MKTAQNHRQKPNRFHGQTERPPGEAEMGYGIRDKSDLPSAIQSLGKAPCRSSLGWLTQTSWGVLEA